MCEAEVAINRLTAPALYLGIGAVARDSNGRLALSMPGAPPRRVVEWMVVMNRFDQDALFDRMAARGSLTEELALNLAEVIARFHERAESRTKYGGRSGFQWLLDSNAAAFAECDAQVFDNHALARLCAELSAALNRHGAVLDTRRREGKVRRCHGDLHLRNICLLDGRPVLFDAIEFSERIACIDVLYDLAFLLMDLEHRDRRDLATLILNRYLDVAHDYEGLAALPLYLSCRAAVRAHVTATTVDSKAGRKDVARGIAEARAYLDLALQFLNPPPARLVAVAGLSGTGKSTLAKSLAPLLGPSPGAVVLRSDVLRKELLGAKTWARLGPEGYRPEVTKKVYRTLVERAAAVIETGHAAIVDAVFAAPREREAIAEAAAQVNVPFTGLWLEAPAAVLERRIAGRGPDASDATVAVLHRQLGYRLGEITWRRVDASGDPKSMLRAARRALDARGHRRRA